MGETAAGNGRDAATAQILGNNTEDGLQRIAEATGTNLLSVTVECGTQPLNQVLEALRVEQALYNHGDASHPRFAEIKQQMREAFYVETPEWKQSVSDSTLGYLQGAVNWLLETH